MVWDEENRLRGINDNGRLHLYTYDHTGERALKSSAESSMAVINGLASAVITHTEDYTAYVSPYFVVQKGKFTKHYFEGSSRIVSKLGEGTFSHKNTGIMAGGLDYLRQTTEQQRIRDEYIKGLQVPPGPPTQHGIYASPEWTDEPYPSISWSDISQNTEPPAGWPRPPKFNEPDDVPGPPVQFGPPVTNNNVKAGHGFIPNGVEEKNLYYYHPDHLGSSSYITNKDGEIIQHTEYIAFGETFVDEHSVSKTMPYLFNAKELDYETGLYYYGARYYDPRVSIFLNVDPLVEKTMTAYAYVNNNPIRFIDPTGMEAEDPPSKSLYEGQVYKDDTGVFIGGKDGIWKATRKDGTKEVLIPEVQLKGKSGTTMASEARQRYYDAIANCSGCQQIETFEKFLFYGVGSTIATGGAGGFALSGERLLKQYGVEIEYQWLWKYMRTKFKSVLKVPRKINVKKNPDAEADFLKTANGSGGN